MGNLNYRTTPEQLSEFLSPAGEIVDVYFATDRETGRPRGFAFVTFSTEGQAAEAIRQFNNADLDGRSLNINEARDRPQRPTGGMGGPGPRGDRPPRPSRPPGRPWSDSPRGDSRDMMFVDPAMGPGQDVGWEPGGTYERDNDEPSGDDDWSGGGGGGGAGRKGAWEKKGRKSKKGSRRGLRARKRSL